MSGYSNAPGSELVSYIIEYYENSDSEEVVTAEPEAHYDHYGNRGAADLYIETRSEVDGNEYSQGYVYEVKSERAVKEANGAGDIIRQFNRMARYFFQDQSRGHPGMVHYELSFLPTPVTLRHVEKNKTLYQNVHNYN